MADCVLKESHLLARAVGLMQDTGRNESYELQKVLRVHADLKNTCPKMWFVEYVKNQPEAALMVLVTWSVFNILETSVLMNLPLFDSSFRGDPLSGPLRHEDTVNVEWRSSSSRCSKIDSRTRLFLTIVDELSVDEKEEVAGTPEPWQRIPSDPSNLPAHDVRSQRGCRRHRIDHSHVTTTNHIGPAERAGVFETDAYSSPLSLSSTDSTMTPTTKRRGKPRTYHTKSRGGCITCKKRHIKVCM